VFIVLVQHFSEKRSCFPSANQIRKNKGEFCVMTTRDFLPRNWAAFAVWFANFIVQLEVLKTKYGVSSEKIEALGLDNLWTQFWANKQDAAKQQKKQLTDFVDGVRQGKLGAPELSNPVWSLGTMPGNVPTGINDRIREAANFIKSQKSIYSIADGELLGIVTAEEAGKAESDYIPALTLDFEPNYNLEAVFRLLVADALQVEYRFKGGDWIIAATLTSSPGTFNIVPTIPGEAQYVEIRAIFIVKNKPFGQYSPTYSTVIKP
jgi:hypothetical protein